MFYVWSLDLPYILIRLVSTVEPILFVERASVLWFLVSKKLNLVLSRETQVKTFIITQVLQYTHNVGK